MTYCLESHSSFESSKANEFSENLDIIEFVQSSNFLMITTMHGLLDRFLRNHGGVMGLSSQYQIVSGSEALVWRKKVFKDLLLSHKKHAQLLSFFQADKLLTLLKNYESLYWHKEYRFSVPEDFERNAKELSKAVGQKLFNLSKEIVTQNEAWLKYAENLKQTAQVLSGDSSWSEVRKFIEDFFVHFPKPRQNVKTFKWAKDSKNHFDKLNKQIQGFLDPGFDPNFWLKATSFHKAFSDLSEEYMVNLYNLKVKESALEMDDLENYSLKILFEQSKCR